MKSGILIINKPRGMSSNYVLTKIKKNCKIDKVGHFGTLDPLAQGVLVVGINKATKLFDYFLNCKKEYTATMKFGKETTTLDLEGEVVKEDNKTIDLLSFENACKSFIGGYNQLPPMYSAKKVDGKRSYDLIRKGIETKLNPKFVEIFEITNVKCIGDNEFEFSVLCGSGTYIRSLVRDIAYKLDSVATMTKLIRTYCCNSRIENAINIDDLNQTNIFDYLISFDKVLSNVPKYKLDNSYYDDLIHGRPIYNLNIGESEHLLYCNNELFGLAKNIENKLVITTYLHE